MTLQEYNENRKTIYSYIVDLNERGYYYARVENSNGKTVFSLNNEVIEEDENGEEVTGYGGIDLIEFGYMKNVKDMQGLKGYLVDMKIMKNNWQLKFVG